jgi:hypothetical protein
VSESFVEVTSGSGLKLHTNTRVIGTNTVHDEVVIPGEPYLPTFFVSRAASIATGNDHLLALMAGASVNLRIRRIHLRQSVIAAAAGTADFAIFRLSTAGTGGTVLTPAPFDTTDTASSTARSLPSAKGTETTNMFQLHVGLTATYPTYHEAEWVQHPSEKPIIVPAGTSNGIAIKNLVAVTTATIECRIEFSESSF